MNKSVQKAQVLFQAEKLEEALDLLANASDKEAKDPDYWVLRAKVLRASGDRRRAIKMIITGLEDFTESAPLWVLFVQFLLEGEEYHHALEVAKLAIEQVGESEELIALREQAAQLDIDNPRPEEYVIEEAKPAPTGWFRSTEVEDDLEMAGEEKMHLELFDFGTGDIPLPSKSQPAPIASEPTVKKPAGPSLEDDPAPAPTTPDRLEETPEQRDARRKRAEAILALNAVLGGAFATDASTRANTQEVETATPDPRRVANLDPNKTLEISPSDFMFGELPLRDVQKPVEAPAELDDDDIFVDEDL